MQKTILLEVKAFQIACAVLKSYCSLLLLVVPTLANYDASYDIPDFPAALEVLDDSPSESILYIGVWGGALLNSFKYFTGSPMLADFELVVDITACTA